MSINSINSAVQNWYPQISTSAPGLATDAKSDIAFKKSTTTSVTSDTVSISAAGQALSDIESNPSVVGAYAVSDYPQQLTADDIKVIDSFPSDVPYNLIRNSVAFAVEAARKSGELKGALTFEALVGGANNPGGLLASLGSDIQAKIPVLALKKAMANGARSLKDLSSDALAKLVRDAFLSNDQDQLGTSQIMRKKQITSAYAV